MAMVSKGQVFLNVLVRLVLPIGVVVIGILAYQRLAVSPPEAALPPATPQVVRTRVAKLHVQDYPVVVKTHGIVQAHDAVLLSTEVAGSIQRISPSFETGSYFAAGEVLLELDSKDYEIAVAVATARELGAQAALQLATLNYERSLELSKRNVITEAEFNLSSANRAQRQAEADSAVAQRERAQRDLERTKIRAPFAGRVGRLIVGLGQTVGIGSSLGEVFAVDFAEVRLPISTRELPFLELPELADDPPVDVELRDSVNAANSLTWPAQIVRTEGKLDKDSLELFAIARIVDPFGRSSKLPPLRIGQPVKASIQGKVLTGVVAVPRTAVRQLDQVFLVDKANLTLSAKTIVPLWQDEDQVIIQDPSLPPDALLATTHLVYAPNGAKVEILPDLESTTTPATSISNDQAKKSLAPSGSSKRQL